MMVTWEHWNSGSEGRWWLYSGRWMNIFIRLSVVKERMTWQFEDSWVDCCQ